MKPFTCAGVWLFLVVTQHYCKAQGHFQNVALGKQCKQSSYHGSIPDHYNECDAAINGNTSGSYYPSEKNCIHTITHGNIDWTPWWQVDLGQSYLIHHIVVWARDGLEYRMSGCQIKVDGDLCYTFGNVSETHSRRFDIVCSQPRSGKVIRIEKSTEPNITIVTIGHYSINMCEFEVYVCSNGYWGSECDTPCGRCISGQACDRQTGDCPAGCDVGLFPPKCTERIVDGQWGSWTGYDACSQSCGGGSQTRRRSCDNPAPVNGGADCSGNTTETQDCNALSCLEGSEPQSAVPVAGIAGAAVGGVVVTAAIAAVIFFVFVRRRGRNTHDAPGTDVDGYVNMSSAKSPERETTTDDNYEDVSGVGTVRPSHRGKDGSCTNPGSAAADSSSTATSSATTATTPGATVYQNVGDPSHDAATNNYESLDVSTVGQRSVYSKLKKPKK